MPGTHRSEHSFGKIPKLLPPFLKTYTDIEQTFDAIVKRQSLKSFLKNFKKVLAFLSEL